MYLSCTCQLSRSQGWSARRLLLPYSLRPPSGMARIFPFGCFVLQGISHLGCLLDLASQKCLIKTDFWGLCYIIEGTFFSQRLQRFGGVPNMSESFSNRPCAIWLVYPVRYSWKSLLSLLVLWLPDRSSGGTYVGSCLSFCYRCSWGLSNVFGRTSLRLR